MSTTVETSHVSVSHLLLKMIRKAIPYRRTFNSDDQLCHDLERLAKLSPHLLADLGFERERAVPHGTSEWRKDQMVVTRQTEPAAVAVRAIVGLARPSGAR